LFGERNASVLYGSSCLSVTSRISTLSQIRRHALWGLFQIGNIVKVLDDWETIETGALRWVYRFASIATSCIAVAACAYMQINEELTSLKGQPLSAAIAKLGKPSEERTVGDQKVFIWYRQQIQENEYFEQECVIRAIMDGDVIGALKFSGDENQCYRYAATLRKSNH